MKNSGDNFPDGLHRRRIEIQGPESGRDVFVISSVTDGIDFCHSSLTQKVVKCRIAFQL